MKAEQALATAALADLLFLVLPCSPALAGGTSAARFVIVSPPPYQKQFRKKRPSPKATNDNTDSLLARV